MQNLLDIIFTVIPILLLALGWRRIPLHYSLFALAVILFSMSFPTTYNEPLLSQPRYMMSAFPIIVILALWGKHPRVDQCFVALAPPLLAVMTILFITHYWVA